MAEGFEVVGDDFNVVVNATWVNYELWRKETVTLTANQSGQIGNYAFSGVTFELLPDAGLAFVHSTAPFIYMDGGWRNGKRLIGIGVDTYSNQPQATVTLYVFRKQAPTGSTSGIQLFNEQGVLVFDGSSKFARIATMVKPSDGTGKFPLPQGRTYAVMLPVFAGTLRVSVRMGGGSGARYTIVHELYGHRFLCESDGVTLLSKAYRFSVNEFPAWNPINGGSYAYTGIGFLVADVTGY